MMQDILTIVWKEWKEITLQRGTVRGGRISLIVIILIMGIIPPTQMGAEWIKSPMAFIIALWIPLVLVSNVVCDSFAGERERHTLETLLASRLSDRAILFGKIAASVSYGWGIAVVMTLIGLVTINIVEKGGALLLYDARMSLSILIGSLLSSTLAAGVGVFISLRAETVRQAQQTMGLAVMLLFLVPMFGVQAIPEEIRLKVAKFLSGVDITLAIVVVLLLLLVFDIALILAALARFRRTHLILD
jgi:ABC-2 type transport system permease protein